MTQRGQTGVRRIGRAEVSENVASESRSRGAALSAVPSALMVVVHGPEAGVRFELHDGALVVGRSEEADLVLTDPAIAASHARLSQENGEWIVTDLGHATSTFVNDERVTEYALRDGDRVRLGRTILKLLSAGDIERRAIDELFRVQNLDGLTQAANTSTFAESLNRDVAHARRHGRALSFVLIDVDSFTKLNESRGEAAGNQVLQRLTTRLRGLLRKQDCVTRLGDDEFAVLLPSAGLADAELIAEKLRAATEPEHVTISAGVSTLSGCEAAAHLIDRARAALHEAKRNGGNRVTSQPPSALEQPRIDASQPVAVDEDDD
jgi:diguanylate cyclase (GGDEF)-like protein